MTETRYTERVNDGKQTFRLYSVGHSGLLENGVDVGCRASSAIACALSNAINDIDGEKNIRISDGVAEIEITADVNRMDICIIYGCFMTARYGFMALAENYPDNFLYDEKID